MKGKKSENNNSTKKQNRTSKGSRENNGNDSLYVTVKKSHKLAKKQNLWRIKNNSSKYLSKGQVAARKSLIQIAWHKL